MFCDPLRQATYHQCRTSRTPHLHLHTARQPQGISRHWQTQQHHRKTHHYLRQNKVNTYPLYRQNSGLHCSKQLDLNENTRPGNSAIVTRKVSPPIMQTKPVTTCKSSPLASQLERVMAKKPAVTCKVSPQIVQPLSPVKPKPSPLNAPIMGKKPVATRQVSAPTGQSVPALPPKFSQPAGPIMPKTPVLTCKVSPPTGLSEPMEAMKLNVTPTVSSVPKSGQAAPPIEGKSAVSRTLSPLTGQFVPVMAKKPPVSRKSPPTIGQRTPCLVEKSVVNCKISPTSLKIL